MAIAFVGAGTVVTGATPVPVPVGYASGNLFIMHVKGSTVISTPTGWTLGVSSSNTYVFYKTAGAAETSVTLTGTNSLTKAYIVAYSGASSPPAVSSIGTATANAITPPTVTTTAANSYLVYLIGGVASSGTTTYTANVSTTQRVNSSGNAGTVEAVLCADELQASIGLSSPRQVTVTGTIVSSTAVTVTLSPSGGTLTNAYWVGGSGTWDTTTSTHWASTSGGAAGAGVVGATTNVFFDANSGSPTVTLSSATCANLNTTNATVLFSGSSSLTIANNVTLGTGTTWAQSGNLTVSGTSTISSAGSVFGGTGSIINLNGATTLGSSVTFSGTTGVTFGSSSSLALSTYTFTAPLISFSAFLNSVTFSSGGNIVLTGNATTVLSTGSVGTYNNVPISLNYSGATGTRTLSCGNVTSPPALSITAGTDTVSFSSCGATAFSSVTFTNFAGTFSSSSPPTSYNFNFTKNGTGTMSMGSALTIGSSNSFTLTSGGLNMSSSTFSAGSFSSNNTNTRSLTLSGSGTTLTGTGTVWDIATTTGLTFNSNFGTIYLDSTAGSRTFNGGGLTYYTLSTHSTPQASSSITFTGANTFSGGISFASLGSAYSLVFPASTTTTFGGGYGFGVLGTSGNIVSIRSSSSGTQATLSQASGTVNVNYLNIQDSAATGGAVWKALTTNGNVNNGNNTGWIFSLASGNFFLMF